MERIPKRTRSIVYPQRRYEEAMIESDLLPLHVRRIQSCDKRFNQILDNPNHKLNNLILKVDTPSNHNLRNLRKIHISKFKTERFKNSFLLASSLNMNNKLPFIYSPFLIFYCNIYLFIL